jgi:hypothetical protein
MTRVLIPPEKPCVVPNFNPAEDMLIFALPGKATGPDDGLDHSLAFAPDMQRRRLEVALTHHDSGARFLAHLPGVTELESDSIAVISLEDAEHLAPVRPQPKRAPKRQPKRVPAPASDIHKAGPHKLAFIHRHIWHTDGPPPGRIFDLTNPESELAITLNEGTGGPIYAIRLTEKGGRSQAKLGKLAEPPAHGTIETHAAIVIAQTAPGTPHLKTGLLAQWVTTRLGSQQFRPLAWIYLGNTGHVTDPATGAKRPFSTVNDSPALAIHGPIAGSIAVTR